MNTFNISDNPVAGKLYAESEDSMAFIDDVDVSYATEDDEDEGVENEKQKLIQNANDTKGGQKVRTV